MNRARLASSRRMLTSLVLFAAAAVGWVYRDSFMSIVQKWSSDAAFSHGFLIVPIALWLAWQKRHALAGAAMRPSWLGVVAVTGCAAVWIVARGTGVLTIEQLVAVALVPALVLAILGPPTARVMMFPLAFLLFAVPFGRAIVPWLMQLTADVSAMALQWTGVPVLRSHMYITIPAGTFEVARACSGLNYVITGLVLGVLFAHLTYCRWTKRLLCVLAFLVIPILANGLRVYFTILLSHLTDMSFGPGTEHVTFGRIFFIAVIFGMFWIGRRWQDSTPRVEHIREPKPRLAERLPASAWVPVPFAVLIALLAPLYLASSLASADERVEDVSRVAVLPVGTGGWHGPIEGEVGWRPLYHGGLVERHGVYLGADDAVVAVFVAVYGPGTSFGAEMITYNNILFASEQERLVTSERRKVALPGGNAFEVQEVVAPNMGAPLLVWHWYMVNDRPETNRFAVKALEAAAFVTRSAATERIVTLSTPLDDVARQRLQSFVTAHAGCVGAGFAFEACGG